MAMAIARLLPTSITAMEISRIMAKKGIDSLHIMRLGRWESIQMVERYTRSVRFEDSLKLYSAIVD